MEREQHQTEIRDLQDQLSEMHDELDSAKRSEDREKGALIEVRTPVGSADKRGLSAWREPDWGVGGGPDTTSHILSGVPVARFHKSIIVLFPSRLIGFKLCLGKTFNIQKSGKSNL